MSQSITREMESTLRDYRKAHQEVVAEMKGLCDLNKTVSPRVLTLWLQIRNSQAYSLRWRDRTRRGLGETAVLSVIESFPEKMRRWYRELCQKVLWLNAQEQIYRHAMSVAWSVLSLNSAIGVGGR